MICDEHYIEGAVYQLRSALDRRFWHTSGVRDAITYGIVDDYGDLRPSLTCPFQWYPVMTVYRNPKLLRAAHECACVLCGKQGYTVAAHSNALRHGHGYGHKAPDYRVAYVCGDPGGCHDKIDGRAGGLTKEEKRELWALAYEKTVALWFERGIVKVAA